MFRKLWNIYYDGFRYLPYWGKVVLTIVLVKLFVMFIVIRLFFMPDYLNSQCATDEEKGDYVFHELTVKFEQ